MLDDFDDDVMDDEFVDEEDELPPEESGNRTFLIAVGILGFLIVVSLLCLGGVLLSRSRVGADRAAKETEAAIAFAQQTQVALAAQQTQDAAATMTAMPTDTPIPTDTPTPTQVVVQPTDTPEPTQDPRTATVEALLTEAAASTPVDTPTGLPTALPDTGFMDDVGVPGLLGLAALAVVVIFIVRRLRAATG